MEENETQELIEKYDKNLIADMNQTLDKEKEELEKKIKDGIRWGEKTHPLKEGDYVVGIVESVEAGRDAKTEHLTFVTIKGKCSIDGIAQAGYVTFIANPVLRTGIKQGVIRTGNTVFIRFDGLKQGKRWDEPYKLYSYKIVEPK